MSSSGAVSSPHTFRTPLDELAYYKAQYEHLATELSEFQETSRELEAEFEKDAEAAEKREMSLKTTLETLRFEVIEWKTKHRQCKSDANAAQSDLEKEITSLRDINRSLQSRMRELEVANDDYERQARNTTSSLDDLASKCDVILERNILLEEEVRMGEQERETLRIETQRLRDELSDSRIEAEVAKHRLMTAEKPHETYISSTLSTNIPSTQGLLSSASDQSLPSALKFSHSIPMAPQSETSTFEFKASTSPPTPGSAASAAGSTKAALSSVTAQPKPSHVCDSAMSVKQNDADHRVATATMLRNETHKDTPTVNRQTLSQVSRVASKDRNLPPRSGSLYQIRGLMGKMQKLEERVQSVKSKLPAPADNSPVTSRVDDVETVPTVPESAALRKSSKRLTEGIPTSNINLPRPEGKRETIKTSRISLAGQLKDEPSRVRSRVSLATHTGFTRASTSDSGDQPVSGRLGHVAFQKGASDTISHADEVVQSSDRLLADRGMPAGRDIDTLGATCTRTTPDDQPVIRGVRKLERPLRQGSQSNLRASISGAAGASRRVSRPKNSTTDAL